MTFLKFIRNVHIHPILILFIIIAMLTGTFVQLLSLLLIVFIHEMGHYLAAYYYKWRIRGIILWVFGGVMQTEESATRPLHEELIVTLAGPLQHVFIYIILFFLQSIELLPVAIFQQISFYNGLILMFNLMPIFPLDGGKILFLILSTFLPFQLAHRFTILFSFFACVLLIILQIFFFSFTFTATLLIVFLFIENRKEWKEQAYIFIRFLFNRLTLKQQPSRVLNIEANNNDRLMDIFKQFIRTRTHHIYVDSNQFITERDCLSLYFNDKKYTETIGELKNDMKK